MRRPSAASLVILCALAAPNVHSVAYYPSQSDHKGVQIFTGTALSIWKKN